MFIYLVSGRAERPSDLNTFLSFAAYRVYLAEILKPVLRQYLALDPESNAYADFVKLKQAEAQGIEAHARKVEQWKRQQDLIRENELQCIKHDRKTT